MKCVICKKEDTRPGTTVVTLQRGGAILVVRNVPAEICPNCGEAYLSEDVSRELLAQAEEAIQAGVVVGLHEFVVATT